MNQLYNIEDNRKTIVYIESIFHAEINDYIQSNYNQIIKLSEQSDINFLYLPYLLQSSEYKELVDYNHPFLNIDPASLDVADIYNQILLKSKIEISGACLVRLKNYKTDNEEYCILSGDENTFYTKLAEFIKKINQKHIIQFELYPDIIESREVPKKSNSKEQLQNKIIPNETEELESEIWQKIELLKEKGSLKFIGEIIDELQKVTRKVSRLFITDDYRIFLMDYGMLEVLMPPLSKCLFLLFLYHPEGILYKHLSNYHDELLSIYRNVTVREDIDTAIESIKAMTDPLNNSVNEKASRIRAAFLELISDDLAKNYYVTGKRGETKRIELDRSMVEYQY